NNPINALSHADLRSRLDALTNKSTVGERDPIPLIRPGGASAAVGQHSNCHLIRPYLSPHLTPHLIRGSVQPAWIVSALRRCWSSDKAFLHPLSDIASIKGREALLRARVDVCAAALGIFGTQ